MNETAENNGDEVTEEEQSRREFGAVIYLVCLRRPGVGSESEERIIRSVEKRRF